MKLTKHLTFYGTKMLIADLSVVTAWALALYGDFNSLSAECLLLLTSFVTIRVTLSFEMQRRSPWTLFSALTFALCYIIYFRTYGYLTYPYSLSLIWIIGLPIITGILQNNNNQIDWKKKWLWVTMTILFISAFCVNADKLWGSADKEQLFKTLPWLILTTTPVFYWIFYQCKNRSLVQLLFSYRPLVIYTTVLILLSIYLLLGQQDIKSYKILTLSALPLIVYVLLCKWSHITPISTKYAVALSLAGLSYWFTITTPQSFKITAMVIGIILTIYVAVEIAFRKHHLWIGITLFLVITIGSPVILGFNPYILTDTDYITQFYADAITYKADNGIFITVKNNRIGLRNRYSKILNTEYDLFNKLDSQDRYISTQQGAFTTIINNNYGVYDIQEGKFILDPDSLKITEMILIADKEYLLRDGNRKNFAILYLPGFHHYLPDFPRGNYLEKPLIVSIEDYEVGALPEAPKPIQ